MADNSSTLIDLKSSDIFKTNKETIKTLHDADYSIMLPPIVRPGAGAGTENETPPNSEISVSAGWTSPLNEEERQLVQQYPVLEKAVEFLPPLMELIAQRPFYVNRFIASAESYATFRNHQSDYLTGLVHLFCGEYNARRGALILIRDWTRQCLAFVGKQSFLENWTEPQRVKECIAIVRRWLMDWSALSEGFQKALCESGLMNDLLSDVSVLSTIVGAENQVSYYESTHFRYTLFTLSNCSRTTSCAAFMRDAGALSVLRPVRQSNFTEVKWTSLASMCRIARDNPNDFILADCTTLEFGIELLKDDIVKNNACIVSAGVAYVDCVLPKSLESIAQRPENWGLLVHCGVLSVLVAMLRCSETAYQMIGSRIVKTLSQCADIRWEIRKKEAEVESLLEGLGGAEEGGVREAAQGALSALRTPDNGPMGEEAGK